jgi:hypothetical protein
MRSLASCAVLLNLILASAAFADKPLPEPTTVSCTFEDEKQISVRYIPVPTDKEPPRGQPWAPGGTPMILFTQTEVTLANTTIPIGAFSMYVIPGKDSWTLVINRNVTAGAKYDQQQDLVRAPMEMGQLSQPEKQLGVYFGRIGPKQCNLRIYHGKTGLWAELKEK